MNPGDVILAILAGAAGASKLRPALVLALLPGPYQRFLVCGISSRLGNVVANWDEPVSSGDADWTASGLHRPSVIRLSYLQALMDTQVSGAIGRIDPARLARLQTRFADRIRP